MIPRLCRNGAVFAATLGLALSAPAAFAQGQAGATPQQAPSQGSAQAGQPDTGPTPSDAELKNFAHAALEVQGIRESMQPKIAAAKTADARTQVKHDAEKKMEAAVQRHQLSLQRYVQIATVVQQDSAIRAKVQSFMPPKPAKS